MSVSIGSTNKAAISAISLLDKREILKNAIDVQNEEGLLDIMQMSGRMVETKQPIFHDYSEDALYQLIDTTGSTVTNNNSTEVTITDLPVASSGFLRKGEKIVFTNGKVGQVKTLTTSASKDTVVIKSVDGTALAVTAGQKLSPIGTLVGEKSTAPSNRKYGWTKYFNLVEIFREVNEITDVQDASEIELEYNGQNYVFNRDIANKFIKFKGDINATFIAGRISATKFEDASPDLTDPTNSGAEQTTMGLNQYVGTYGVNATVATPGTLILADLEAFFNLLTAARAPKKHMALSASSVMAKVDNCLKGLASGGVNSARLNLDGKDLDFDVNSMTYMGRRIQFGVLPIFDHPVIVSQTDIVKSLYFVPEDKVATKSGAAEDRIRVRYMKNKQKGFGNDIYAEWDSGALARQGATGDEMLRRTNWVTTQGLQFLGGSHFGKLVVLS